MPELKVSNEELQSLLVEQLGVIDQADFDRASRLAQRLRTPLIHTLVEQGRASHKHSYWTNLPAAGMSVSST